MKALERVPVVIKQEGGRDVAYVDGLHVDMRDGQNAIEAAVERVALLAGLHGAGSPKQVLMLATDHDGKSWDILVDEHGKTELQQQSGAPTNSLPVVSGPRAQEGTPSPDSTQSRQHKLALPTRAGASAALKKLKNRPPPRWDVVVVVVAAVAVALALLFSVGFLLRGGGSADDKAPVEVSLGGELPQAPPLEWKKAALWSSPPLLSAAGRIAVVDQNAVGLVTADRRVAVVDDDGSTRWTQALPDGEVHTPLTLTMIGQDRVLAMQVGSRMVWWRDRDGAVGGVDLPSESTPVSWRGDTPLIGLDENTVGVIQDGEIARVSVPSGARAISGWPDGHVVAATAAGWWRLRPSQDPGKATAWETPNESPDQLTVIDGIGPLIITVSVTAQSQVEAVVHIDTPQGVRRLMAGVLPDVSPGDALTWRPGTSRTWGILGHAIIDAQKASVTDLGSPLTVQHVIADRAAVTIGEQQTVVSPDAQPGLLEAGESFPEEILGRNAVVRAEVDGQQRIYVLPPAMETPSTEAPTPATTPGGQQ